MNDALGDKPKNVDPASDKALPADGRSEAVSAKDALKKVTDPTELTDGFPGSAKEDLGAGTLSRFLTFYPFTRFFCALADRRYPASHNPQTRVARMREEHTKFYWGCVLADFVVIALCTVLLISAAAIVLYKSLLGSVDLNA